jgi:cellulose synthase operon protein YhjQ
MGFYWTGTGFEERLNLMPLPPADSAKRDSQSSITLETVSDSPVATKGKFSCTQDRALQKVSQDVRSRFGLQADPTPAESRKEDNDATVGAGLVSYDPNLGSWVRAQVVAASATTLESPEGLGRAAASAENEIEESQKKSARESDSLFRWTSLFRTEQGWVLVTPPPERSSEAQLESVAASDDAPAVPSSGAAEDLSASEANTPDAQEIASASVSSLVDIQEIASPDATTTADLNPAVPAPLPSTSQDVIISDSATAAADESSLLSAPSYAMDQDTASPDGTASAGDQVASGLVSATAPDEKSEGSIWQSAVEQREGIVPSTSSVEEMREATPGPDKSHWFVLNNVLGRASERQAPASEPEDDVPVLQVFSLAGGTGKSILVATLGRALSSRGERVLLVEATPIGSLQYFFGACDWRPGVIRTFRPPDSKSDAPVRLASIAPESLLPESANQTSIAVDIRKWAQGASRAIVDVGTGSASAMQALSKISLLVLVPLVPDVNSLVSAKVIDSFFLRHSGASVRQSDIFYVLNQFDSSQPLHHDVRRVLQKRLGHRLLPMALERAPEMSEALAEGMTIMDYAPDSKASANFTSLANWLQEVQKATATNPRGRWSER